jgi:N-acetylglucosamine kinase-like BadF-type ATPase
MRLFAGIDGGQSSTQAVIGNEFGEIIARGSAGPADEVGQDATSTRLRDALQDALVDAIVRAQLPADSRFEAVVAGVSGYEGMLVGVPPSLPADRFIMMHDAPIAHAAALGGAPGVVVIAGTGSVAYGVASDGRSATTGGWGYLFGDEGSAFWIARTAISVAAMHETCEGARALESFFGYPNMRALVRAFYNEMITRDAIASFARVCLDAAHAGTTSCWCLTQPVESAAIELARLAVDGVVDETEPFLVSFTGGLMRDAWFKEQVHGEAVVAFETAYEEVVPDYYIVEPLHDSAVGALILAYKEVLPMIPQVREA